jgi:hypothetical protein
MKKLSALLIISFLFACTATFNWREIRSDEQGFSALFPAKTTFEQKQFPFKDRPIDISLEASNAGDAVFAILKPGVILSSKHDMHLHLANDFPGWEVLKIWDSSIWAAMEVGKFKYDANPGAWYIQGQTPTPEFTEFVDTYLKKWTGFVAETVFDVNCLVLDEENVIFSAYNKAVFDFCKRHRINPIISELRHSYFWDGGISCCTQDLRRRGGLETYL